VVLIKAGIEVEGMDEVVAEIKTLPRSYERK
jgi:hypothetical protein